ncbi:MAG: hypothetical protein KDJ97_34210 [Anaerolineae bacterium]|nr:hypothetical protein [Anaerolineae bacterium]
MTALSKDADTPAREGVIYEYPLADDAEIFAGGIVVLDAGEAVAGSTDTGLVAVGRAEHYANQANGDGTIKVRRGVFRWANSADTDAITLAEVGSTCYIVDDATVAKTDDDSARSAAGIVRDVDSNGVWVEI